MFDRESIEGTIPALLTPFTAGGKRVDHGILDAHLEWLNERGIRIVSPMGTTGEGASLALSERKELIERIARHPSGIRMLVGTGCTALPETIELSHFAVAMGAVGILVAPPTYYVPDSARSVTDYYAGVLDALPEEARVFLYHIPQQTRVAIAPETIRALSEHFGPKLAGIKDSGGDFEHTEHLFAAFPAILVLNGNDRAAAQAYAAGGRGVISATANILPEEFERIRAGETDRQEIVTQTRALADDLPRHSALKLLLHIVSGLPHSSVRPPLSDLTEAESGELVRRFEAVRAEVGA